MQSTAKTVQEYLETLPEDRKSVMKALRETILEYLPEGFAETMTYGMITYVVPHSLYPQGYHCDPKQALPFVSIASQKNHIALYHMGLYGDQALLLWFEERWKQISSKKLDMGKSCIRFKKPEDVPLKLIGELMAKISPQEWIDVYEQNLKKN
jgi:hypothetical protein